MKKLTQEEFKSTINDPFALDEGQPTFDFWSYVDDIPREDYEGHDCSEGNVYKVYRMNENDFEHVLIYSNTENVFLAIVNDLENSKVYGHCLLDFNKVNGEKS